MIILVSLLAHSNTSLFMMISGLLFFYLKVAFFGPRPLEQNDSDLFWPAGLVVAMCQSTLILAVLNKN